MTISDPLRVFAKKLPSGWQLLPFEGMLAEPVRNGIYKTKEFHGKGTRVVNMGELFGFDFISGQEMKRIELTVDEEKKSGLNDGDLLFARRSLVLEGAGKCSLVVNPPEAITFESSIIRARPNRRVAEPRFLFYLFTSPLGRAIVASIATRTAVSGIRGSDLSQVGLPLPPLSVQRRIASILSAYDELMENCQRRIGILETVARTLYREWFIHFRFPGHEKLTRIASQLGDIPRGWEIKRVPECVDVNPRVAVLRDVEKPFVSMGCLANDSMLVTDIQSRDGNSGAKFQNGDTLFARITPCLENGKTGFVQFLPDAHAVACGSTEFIVLRSRTLTPEFTYLLARTDDFRGNAIKSMSGASGRQRVQERCFDDYKIAHPPRALLDQFSAIVAPSFRLIQKLHLQTQNLRRTRDLLLPRLLSGAS